MPGSVMQLISNAHAWHMCSDPVATTRNCSHSTMWRLLITCSGVLLLCVRVVSRRVLLVCRCYLIKIALDPAKLGHWGCLDLCGSICLGLCGSVWNHLGLSVFFLARCMHNAHCWYGAVVTVLSHVLHVVARCRDPAAECLTQSDETLRIGRRLGRAPGPLGSCPRICSGMRLAVNSCHSILSAFHQLRAS